MVPTSQYFLIKNIDKITPYLKLGFDHIPIANNGCVFEEVKPL